ncbi:hypothetical protein M0R72_06810 [Candidatus Pacearchaeota archaeon]|jgi:hypothetical protein|nr:hypothetical protein [Candidatus Pacearchaeota archaeon]
MSSLSAALAAALQNDSGISILISGVISGRNFTLQDALLAASPYACIAICDLPVTRKPYLGASDMEKFGQIEVRCISKSSEQECKDLADAVIAYLSTAVSLPWQGATIPFNLTNIYQFSDTSDDLSIWLEILTIDYI